MRVGCSKIDEFEPPLLNHSVPSNFTEPPPSLLVDEPMVDRWWWCGVRGRFLLLFLFWGLLAFLVGFWLEAVALPLFLVFTMVRVREVCGIWIEDFRVRFL